MFCPRRFVLHVRSPVITTLLLTKVSGIPMLEKSADAKWGTDPSYQRYKAATPVLFPVPFVSTGGKKE
jgi:steroid 5-alpha reductase family enzyme